MEEDPRDIVETAEHIYSQPLILVLNKLTQQKMHSSVYQTTTTQNKHKLKPRLITIYTWPGNVSRLFLQPRSLYEARKLAQEGIKVNSQQSAASSERARARDGR